MWLVYRCNRNVALCGNFSCRGVVVRLQLAALRECETLGVRLPVGLVTLI